MSRKTISKAAVHPMVAVATIALLFAGSTTVSAKPIPIAKVKHPGKVDFQKEILPILRQKCLACHNSTDAESDLILETPELIRKGGSEGPAVVPKQPGKSLLLLLGAKQKEPFMPPEDNDVQAKPLTSKELGLIKLWIEQGATGKVTRQKVVFSPLPPGVNPVYAVAISPDGQYAAAGRANQIFIYHVPSKRTIGRLTDPALLKSKIYNAGVAHMDLVQSLAFDPASQRLASGGYRTVKIWRRAGSAPIASFKGLDGAVQTLAVDGDGRMVAFGQADGKIQLYDLGNNRLVRTVTGHAGAVTALQYTADSTKVISASADKSVRIWNAANGKQLGKIDTPAAVAAIAAMADDTTIAVGGADKSIRLFTLASAKGMITAKAGAELKGHTGAITSLAPISGTQFLSGSLDGTLRVWDAKTAKQVRSLAHGGPVVSVAVKPDGTRFASASSNKIAKLWDAKTGKMVAELKGNLSHQLKVASLTREATLAKRMVDLAKNDLKAANAKKTAETKTHKTATDNLKKQNDNLVKKIAAAKKPVADKMAADKALATAQASLAAAQKQQAAANAVVTVKSQVAKLLQPDLAAAAKRLAAATKESQAADAAAAQAAAAAKKAPKNKALATKANAANAAAQTAKIKLEAATSLNSAIAALVKTATDASIKAAATAKTATATIAKANAAIKTAQANVKKVAAAATKATNEKNAADRAVATAKRALERAQRALKKATDAVPGKETLAKSAEAKQKAADKALADAKAAAAGSDKPLLTVRFSNDGSTIVTGGEDQVVHTWDGTTGAALQTFSGQGGAITGVGFTANNDVISAAANKTAVVWSGFGEWTLERTIGDVDDPTNFIDRVTALHFSPDGKTLATGSGEPSRSGEIKLWNVKDGKLVRAIKEPHSDTVFDVEFSRDGKYIASCAADRFVKVFEVKTGKFLKAFEGHTHHVLGVSWNADGRSLASSGADKVIKVWNFLTGDQQRTIGGFSKEVTAIQYVADGTTLVASGGDNTVQLKNAGNGSNIRSLSGPKDFMYAVRASGDGNTIIAGGQDSVVRVWLQNGTVFVTFEPPATKKTASTGGGGE